MFYCTEDRRTAAHRCDFACDISAYWNARIPYHTCCIRKVFPRCEISCETSSRPASKTLCRKQYSCTVARRCEYANVRSDETCSQNAFRRHCTRKASAATHPALHDVHEACDSSACTCVRKLCRIHCTPDASRGQTRASSASSSP